MTTRSGKGGQMNEEPAAVTPACAPRGTKQSRRRVVCLALRWGRIVRFGVTVKSVNLDLKVAKQVLLFSTIPKPESQKNPVAPWRTQAAPFQTAVSDAPATRSLTAGRIRYSAKHFWTGRPRAEWFPDHLCIGDDTSKGSCAAPSSRRRPLDESGPTNFILTVANPFRSEASSGQLF